MIDWADTVTAVSTAVGAVLAAVTAWVAVRIYRDQQLSKMPLIEMRASGKSGLFVRVNMGFKNRTDFILILERIRVTDRSNIYIYTFDDYRDHEVKKTPLKANKEISPNFEIASGAMAPHEFFLRNVGSARQAHLEFVVKHRTGSERLKRISKSLDLPPSIQ